MQSIKSFVVKFFPISSIRNTTKFIAMCIAMIGVQNVHADYSLSEEHSSRFVKDYFFGVDNGVDSFLTVFQKQFIVKGGLANLGNSLFTRRSKNKKFFVVFNNVNYEMPRENDLYYYCSMSSGEYIYVFTQYEDYGSELCRNGTFIFRRGSTVYFWRLSDGVKGKYEYEVDLTSE